MSPIAINADCRQPIRKLMTFNTSKGVCSLTVNLNDLKKPSSLVPVRKSLPAMPGVTHYEVQSKKFPKTKSWDEHRFGFCGKVYRKTVSGVTKIPVPSKTETEVKSRCSSANSAKTFSESRERRLSEPSVLSSVTRFGPTTSSESKCEVRRTRSTDVIPK